MSTYDNCSKCTMGLQCGWSNIEPNKEIDTTQMIAEPCKNLCKPTIFTADNVDVEGLCRVFEAAAMREYKDKCAIPGRKGRKCKPARHKGGRR